MTRAEMRELFAGVLSRIEWKNSRQIADELTLRTKESGSIAVSESQVFGLVEVGLEEGWVEARPKEGIREAPGLSLFYQEFRRCGDEDVGVLHEPRIRDGGVGFRAG
jgi:hypothetical protein